MTNEKMGTRCVDIARYMNHRTPTASNILRKLKKEAYVCADYERNYHLTEKGSQIASQIYERYLFLRDLLITVGVPERIARQDACRMEHRISEQTYQKIQIWKEEIHI